MYYIEATLQVSNKLCFIVTAAARIDKGPANIGARFGSNIQLKCMLGRRSCERVLWSRTEQTGSTDTVYAGNEMYNDHEGRYSVNVSPARECTLHINRLQLSDAGIFTCAERKMKKSAVVTVIGIAVHVNIINMNTCTTSITHY